MQTHPNSEFIEKRDADYQSNRAIQKTSAVWDRGSFTLHTAEFTMHDHGRLNWQQKTYANGFMGMRKSNTQIQPPVTSQVYIDPQKEAFMKNWIGLLAIVSTACLMWSCDDSEDDDTQAAWLATYDSSADYYDSLAPNGTTNIGEPANQIYALALDSIPSDTNQEIVLIQSASIVDQTLSDDSLPDSDLQGNEAAADYLAKNAEATVLSQYGLEIGKDYSFLSNNNLKSDNDRDQEYWDEFAAKYPFSSGIYSLSRIGFSEDSTKAIVRVDNICGPLCARSQTYLMIRSDSSWSIEQVLSGWVR